MRGSKNRKGEYDYYGEYPEVFCPVCKNRLLVEFWGEGVGKAYCLAGHKTVPWVHFSPEEQEQILHEGYQVA